MARTINQSEGGCKFGSVQDKYHVFKFPVFLHRKPRFCRENRKASNRTDKKLKDVEMTWKNVRSDRDDVKSEIPYFLNITPPAFISNSRFDGPCVCLKLAFNRGPAFVNEV